MNSHEHVLQRLHHEDCSTATTCDLSRKLVLVEAKKSKDLSIFVVDRGTGNHSSIRILQFLCRVGSYSSGCKSLNQFVSLCPCDNRYFWTYVQYVKVILFSWPDSCDTFESSSDSCRLDRRYISMIDEARWIVVLLFSITRIWTSRSFKKFVLQWRFAIIRRNQESSWLIWS